MNLQRGPNHLTEQTTWLACGENCMPIDVLRRHKKNAPSTPYSTGRSDVEQLSYFEESMYSDFLNKDYLIKVNAFTDRCYLNIKKRSNGTCQPGRHYYLEFTHHDPTHSTDREKLKRRIDRMLQSREREEEQILFYHHRSTTGFKRADKLLKKHFIEILSRYKGSAKAYCYSQKLVRTSNERGLSIRSCHNDRILFFTLKTLHPWGGSNLDNFFGRNDEDLFNLIFRHHSNHSANTGVNKDE